jgi:hypothetical protein
MSASKPRRSSSLIFWVSRARLDADQSSHVIALSLTHILQPLKSIVDGMSSVVVLPPFHLLSCASLDPPCSLCAAVTCNRVQVLEGCTTDEQQQEGTDKTQGERALQGGASCPLLLSRLSAHSRCTGTTSRLDNTSDEHYSEARATFPHFGTACCCMGSMAMGSSASRGLPAPDGGARVSASSSMGSRALRSQHDDKGVELDSTEEVAEICSPRAQASLMRSLHESRGWQSGTGTFMLADEEQGTMQRVPNRVATSLVDDRATIGQRRPIELGVLVRSMAPLDDALSSQSVLSTHPQTGLSAHIEEYVPGQYDPTEVLPPYVVAEVFGAPSCSDAVQDDSAEDGSSRRITHHVEVS